MWCTGILVPMARARTPEGKRVVIPVRVSEPMAAELDKARGELTRSSWLRAVAGAYLVAAAGGQVSTVPELEHGGIPVHAHPEPEPMPVYTYTASPEPEPERPAVHEPSPELVPERKPRRTPRASACTHKRVTSSKGGKCHDCGDWVPASN